MGWALSKPRVSTRFTSSVKAYLCAKFDLGEKTGLKADPTQVSKDMRNARDQDNKRRFSREWLSKTQIQSYFSQLASSRRKRKELLDADDPSLLVSERLRVLKCESFFFLSSKSASTDWLRNNTCDIASRRKLAPRRRGRVVRAMDSRPENSEFGSHSQEFEKATLCKSPPFFSSSLFATSNSKCVSVACAQCS